jgi:DNA repair protein REV1
MGSRLEQKSNLVRKRIENHTFSDEAGEEYEGSAFGGFTDYFRRKKIKLQNLDASVRAEAVSQGKPQIFRGVVCHVNGYTQPSLNDLHTMIVQHGGGFMQYLDGKTMVTHIIASNLTPKKKEEFKRYRIVKPAWIVDSVKAGHLLPWDGYRVIEEGAGQRTLGFEGGNVVSQAGKKSIGYREQTNESWYTSQLKASQKNDGRRSLSGLASDGQTITPIEDIDGDEFPSLTSSMEQAMERVLPADAEVEDGVYDKQSPAKSTLQTPPPSSPHVGPTKPSVAFDATEDSDLAALDGNVEPSALEAFRRKGAKAAQTTEPIEPHDMPQPDTLHSAKKPALQDREGSQEPDYFMAVIRDSDVMKAVSAEDLANMTAEEHNALLLSDPRIRKSTVVHPDFLDQYYRESRLHHLSTWKADLKAQLQALAAEKTSSQRAILKRLPGQRRYIMHVDFDSFFAAVSLKKCPQFKDKPAVVAHGGGSGSEIASCNYPARKFGIKNGMWMKRAQELYPELKILPYDFPGYEEASRGFYNAIMASGGIVQSVSIDEALVDISAMCIAECGTDGVKRSEGCQDREQRKADEIAQVVRDEVLDKTGCAVSVGIGGNILQAKIALRKAKPAGQYQLKPEDVLGFIGQLEVQSLPGIAWSIGGKLEEIGIKLVKDIRECSREKLINTLGPKTGEKVWEYARGIDKTEVGDQVIRKSVSAEVNWGVRFENQEQVDEFMQGLAGELGKRLLKERVKGKQLTMKVMRRATDAPLDPPKHLGHGKCDTYNKSLQLGVATNDKDLIAKEVVAMMKAFNISPGELRGIGIQMQKLEALKAAGDGHAESSQRRLQFKTGPAMMTKTTAVSNTVAKAADDDIQDDVQTPEKRQRVRDINQPSVIIQPLTARTPTKKPLNITGTQFILPTQVDPKVLAELPPDIRAKLAKHIRPSIEAVQDDAALKPPNAPSRPVSRGQSPAVMLPNMSQLDPTILAELPDDVRAELLGLYKSPRKAREQALLPQSPRKTRILPPPKQPLRRKRGGGGLFAGKSRLSAADNSTLTQSNFVSRPQTALADAPAAMNEEELDPDFLAALPEDIRGEVLAQQRQSRLQRTGGIDTSLHQRRKPAGGKQKAVEPVARVLQLPHHSALPTFTSRKLSSLPDAVKAWYQEISDEAPYDEDVEALIVYLRGVMLDEKDANKAVQIVKWMGWIIERGNDDDDVDDDAQEGWEKALARIKDSVREAGNERGIGSLKLE